MPCRVVPCCTVLICVLHRFYTWIPQNSSTSFAFRDFWYSVVFGVASCCLWISVSSSYNIGRRKNSHWTQCCTYWRGEHESEYICQQIVEKLVSSKKLSKWNEWMDGWMDEWMNEWVNTWKNEGVEGRSKIERYTWCEWQDWLPWRVSRKYSWTGFWPNDDLQIDWLVGWPIVVDSHDNNIFEYVFRRY